MNELEKKEKGKGWFRVENIFIDKYAEIIGYTASIIYICIRRHEYLNKKVAFPSEEFIAKKLGMNTRTVIRHLKILKAHNLIIVKKLKHNGKHYNNTYLLTPANEWLIKPGEFTQSPYVTNNTPTPDKKDIDQVTESHSNKTNIKKTNIKSDSLKESGEDTEKVSSNFLKAINAHRKKLNIQPAIPA
ncbi:MAG: helix-turn-helix domain-containing protein [Patescibacteria group bacterium]